MPESSSGSVKLCSDADCLSGGIAAPPGGRTIVARDFKSLVGKSLLSSFPPPGGRTIIARGFNPWKTGPFFSSAFCLLSPVFCLLSSVFSWIITMKSLARLFKWYDALPKEAKIILALFGLGSMSGILYLFVRYFKQHWPIFVVAAAIILVIWLIIWLFGWSGRRRAAQMGYELSSVGPGGVQSMDVSARIKANNDKFFKAVRELKKSFGVNVYDLPWYIVIGDSGCGKTKLVNESGGTFAGGKPENYQLGTLDYNWWFTEDAIFIDMAGRLCNPQDDRDRKEWMAFLDTIARGRRGYPINGALLCVSAEHLLQDSPEKQEADAHIALERLRDLQAKLGVTFATYLLVTKCDKVLGFMQLFNRAGQDIAIKKQIFGWSRPGEFNKPYDPEKFKGDLSTLYARLNDLRLRRMSDEDDEKDLGLAYAFPEEFRRLLDPLQNYVRTLFPPTKHVKNLIFRGVYFTSATQEGELILTHLAARLGRDAASQFPSLGDMYPTKSPHFIKDVLARKVFPEYGLVFRNEKDVVRNRRLSKALTVVTCALAILLAGSFVWGLRNYRKTIGEPSAWAKDAEARFTTLTGDAAINLAATGEQHAIGLKNNYWTARILCGFVCDPTSPVTDLESIRMALVEWALKNTLVEAGAALRSGTGLAGKAQDVQDYQNALVEYIRWYGCREQEASASNADVNSFNTLMLVAKDSAVAKASDFEKQKTWYFVEVSKFDSHFRRNPAKLLAQPDMDADKTITAAVQKVSEYYKTHFATITENHADPTVAEWMRILKVCKAAEENYKPLLTSGEDADKISTVSELKERQGKFRAAYEAWTGALGKLTSPNNPIKPLNEAIWNQREHWRQYRELLRHAGELCGSSVPKDPFLAALGDENLDLPLWNSLRDAGLATGDYTPSIFADQDSFRAKVKNVYDFDVSGHLLVFSPDSKGVPGGTLGLSPNATTVRNELAGVSGELVNAKLEGSQCLPVNQPPQAWARTLKDHVAVTQEYDVPESLRNLDERWKPKDLVNLVTNYRALVHRGVGTCILQAMVSRLEAATSIENWGFASLTPYSLRAELVSSAFGIEPPKKVTGIDVETDSQSAPPKTSSESKKKGDDDNAILGGDTAQVGTEGPTQGAPAQQTEWIPRCATHAYLNDQAQVWVDLLLPVGKMRGHFLQPTKFGTDSLVEKFKAALGSSAKAYLSAYLRAWDQAYKRKKLGLLEQLVAAVTNWDDLATALATGTNQRDRVAEELRAALSEILESVPLGDHNTKGSPWLGSEVKPVIQEVSKWWTESLRDSNNWAFQDLVAYVNRSRAPNKSPWTVITEEAVQTWKGMADEIAANKNLEDRLKRNLTETRKISWGKIGQLRNDKGLNGEPRFTGALLKFERWVQELLDARLTEILVDIQSKNLKAVGVDSGWPYFNGQQYDDKALDTVQKKNFVDFVRAVVNANTAFKSIEDGLPIDLPGFTLRQNFYEECQKWNDFITKDKLTVEVEEWDPNDLPAGIRPVGSRECREAAFNVQLQMGSRLSVETNCESQYWKKDKKPEEKKKIEWDFSEGSGNWTTTISNASPNVKVDFVSPKRSLGRDSPLALCAYFERYGRSKPGDDQKIWYVVHEFEVRFGGQKDNVKVVQALRFTLEKPLPKPIQKLEPVRAPEPPKWDDVAAAPR